MAWSSGTGIIPALVCAIAIVAAPVFQANAQQAPIASAEYAADPNLRCDLLQVKRVSGGALSIRWRVVNTLSKSAGLSGEAAEPIYYNFSWDELYFIDPAENKKYEFLKDAAGNRILDVFHGNMGPGDQRLNWAKFPAPPAASKLISISIPKFAPFEDVPVSD